MGTVASGGYCPMCKPYNLIAVCQKGWREQYPGPGLD